ncbi:MAG: hypothetical protein OXH59_18480 [Rhodospirillaceae bacterium]|nr:hypothetical protein [Rhodospirillaceae bacterium]
MPWLSLLAEVLAIVLSAVILGAVAWLRRSLAALSAAQAEQSERYDRRLDKVEKEIVKVEDIERHEVIKRVGSLEVALAEAVKTAELDRVHGRVDLLAAEVHSMAGQLGSLDKSVCLIHDHLLDRERR